jgi:hypothetical protein
MTVPSEATESLLEKMRSFIGSLDEAERTAFAALIGPGVALAYRDEDDVEGFGSTWEPNRLPDHLAEMVRAHDLRIEGL